MAGARRPFCADCGGGEVHVVTAGYGNIWLCGSCEMLRANPDAPKVAVPPGLPVNWPKRGRPKQRESLFDDRGV